MKKLKVIYLSHSPKNDSSNQPFGVTKILIKTLTNKLAIIAGPSKALAWKYEWILKLTKPPLQKIIIRTTEYWKIHLDIKIVFRTKSNIKDGAVNYFCKNLYHKCLAGLGSPLWIWAKFPKVIAMNTFVLTQCM